MTSELRPNFGSLDPEWAPKETTNSVRGSVYQKVNNLWANYLKHLPPNYNQPEDIDHHELTDGSILIAKRVIDNPLMPRIKDLEIPKELLPFINRYLEGKKTGKNTPIPGLNSAEACMNLYGELPISDDKDTFGFNGIMDEYDKWLKSSFSWMEWCMRDPKVIGYSAQVSLTEGANYTFGFSNKNELIGFRSYREHPVTPPLEAKHRGFRNYPLLHSEASFRGGKLYSLYYEMPNGTFFKDPKGEIDSIWPIWVKRGKDHEVDVQELYRGARRVDATVDDWEWYLDRVKKREKVFSPVSRLWDVYQTERQARENLEKSRVYIYCRIPQAFHFYITRGDQFNGEVGYSISSKFNGKFIPKKPTDERSYHRLLSEETLQTLSQWDPEQ